MSLELSAMGLLVVGLIVAAVGYAHKNGSLNFFKFLTKKKKQVANIGIGVMVIGGILIAGAVAPNTLNNLGVDEWIVPPSEPLSFGSGSSSDDGSEPTITGYAVETLSASAREAGSNSAANADGILKIFNEGDNPSSATAEPIDTINIVNGVGSSTAKVVQEGTRYRVVFDANGSSHYDYDFGVISFTGLNPNTGVLSFPTFSVTKVATLDDILDENSTQVNGQAAGHVAGTDEISCASGCTADDTLIYDESVGDGQWYIEIKPSASGAHSVAKDTVLVFEHDSTNPPEGDEYSQIVAQNIQGAALNIPSDVTNFWKEELPIDLGDMSGGVSTTYRFTFSVEEANEDGNDDWKLHFDDLGDYRAKDVMLDAKATPDTVNYGGSQA